MLVLFLIPRQRIQGHVSRQDPVSEEIIKELKTQNMAMRKQISDLDEKVQQLLMGMQDLMHSVLPPPTEAVASPSLHLP